MDVLGKTMAVAALVVPIGQVVEREPSAALAPETTSCVSPWDLIDPILWASEVTGAYIGPGLLGHGCEDPTWEPCWRDPIAYDAAVRSVAGAVGVHVPSPWYEPLGL